MELSAYCPDRSIVAKSRHQKTNDYSVSALVSASVGGVSSGGSYVSLYMERSDVDQLSVRRRTYMLWPGWAPVSVDSDALAEAGFYYTGDADEVRCYACRQSFSKWQHGDVPLDVHRRRCPSCPVVLALDRDKKYPPPTSSANDDVDAAVSCSVKLPACDVEVDGPADTAGKLQTAEDCVSTDTSTRQTNVAYSRGCAATTTTTTTTTNLTKPDKAQLMEENRRLRAELVCRQCRTDKVQTLFLPCQHLVACQRCGDAMDDCIRCGQKILGTVRTYIL